jgi:hypothetical protein
MKQRDVGRQEVSHQKAVTASSVAALKELRQSNSAQKCARNEGGKVKMDGHERARRSTAGRIIKFSNPFFKPFQVAGVFRAMYHAMTIRT